MSDPVDTKGFGTNVFPMPLLSPDALAAAQVRALMAFHRDSQSSLGTALGLSQTTISRRLRGEVPIEPDLLTRIAAHYGVPTWTLAPDPEPVAVAGDAA